MFKIFGFGRNASATHPEKQATDNGATTRQHTDIQRELVRVVLNDTLRAHGIPGDWLTCNVTALSGRARGDDILVRLVVLKWHEPLLKYMPALQQQLIAGLDRFEPSIDHSKYIVSWQFSPDCGCPHQQLPNANTWVLQDIPGAALGAPQAPVAPVAPPSIVNWQPDWAAPTAVSVAPPVKAKFDLPPSERDAMPSTFAATEPSPLR